MFNHAPAVFDIETNGLLDDLTTCHTLVVKILGDEGHYVWRHFEGCRKGAEYLAARTQQGLPIVAHNGFLFDIPALEKLYGVEFDMDFVFDSLSMTRTIYPDLQPKDIRQAKKGKFPARLIGKHSLEAWGHRLGFNKGDFKGPWDTWTQEMEDYCVQDVLVLEKLVQWVLSKDTPAAAHLVEQGVARILARQQMFGVGFKEKEAVQLYSKLAVEKDKLHQELVSQFPPVLRGAKVFVPKRDNKKQGYVAGAPFTKLIEQEFNPASRQQVVFRLKTMFDWVPTEFTNKGQPKVDDAVLSSLPYPEVKGLARFYLLEKRISQIATGDEAWLKHAKNGVIYGRVNSNGAVTTRMSHTSPNLAQVPAAYSPYGPECRALFYPPHGFIYQTGVDADALELRCLANRLFKYDGGEYVQMVLNGDKKLGTDVHSRNAVAFGLDPKGTYFEGESGRDISKTAFYAMIYGAGDEKLGFILTRKRGEAAKAEGKARRAAFMKAMPAFATLVKRVKKFAAERKYLIGLDGRKLECRSSHSALNTQLQHDGAWIMKKGLIILDQNLWEVSGLTPGVDYEFMLNVHDEWQIASMLEEQAHEIGKQGIEAIRLAGESVDFKCPLTGDYRVGRNWFETH
jgi:DNA polymerase I